MKVKAHAHREQYREKESRKSYLSFAFYADLALNEYRCLTSTEARRPIQDGDEWEKGER